MTDISVLVPLYGDFCVDRARMTIDSILLQKSISVEVVICECNKQPRMENNIPQGCRYVSHIDEDISGGYNPGAIRNAAAAAASGDFIYTTDADIVFQCENFLINSCKLIEDHSDVILRRPPMRRLIEADFPSITKQYKKKGLKHTINKIYKNNDYIATCDGRDVPLKVLSKISNRDSYTRTFTAEASRLKAFGSDKPSVWWENLHCGGMLFRRKQFEAIGGYCMQFRNWGCEDTDLQWKFSELYRLRFFPYTSGFEVLHLDHLKPYFSQSRFEDNERIYTERRLRGIQSAVRLDSARLTDGSY